MNWKYNYVSILTVQEYSSRRKYTPINTCHAIYGPPKVDHAGPVMAPYMVSGPSMAPWIVLFYGSASSFLDNAPRLASFVK